MISNCTHMKPILAASWTATIPANGSVSVGFQFNAASDKPANPTRVLVNGVPVPLVVNNPYGSASPTPTPTLPIPSCGARSISCQQGQSSGRPDGLGASQEHSSPHDGPDWRQRDLCRPSHHRIHGSLPLRLGKGAAASLNFLNMNRGIKSPIPV